MSSGLLFYCKYIGSDSNLCMIIKRSKRRKERRKEKECYILIINMSTYLKVIKSCKYIANGFSSFIGMVAEIFVATRDKVLGGKRVPSGIGLNIVVQNCQELERYLP